MDDDVLLLKLANSGLKDLNFTANDVRKGKVASAEVNSSLSNEMFPGRAANVKTCIGYLGDL